ncbi:transcription-repair coupling factor [Porphyromonas sp.]|uniref:transcription-repair coupling factor n=1 Tax=Porphyromonas sp. TaxID=1924944 RepID=UPI0026DC160C|nr:transcription-repair coupling factor [Porphyromonas sp.]MDO4770739.1 transcription-repair coupling factor [Porphyromonas sp.]
MELSQLVSRLSSTKAYSSLCKHLSEGKHKLFLLSQVHGSAIALILKALSEAHAPVLCIATDEDEAGYLYSDLSALFDQENQESHVYFFPSLYKRGIRFGQADGANEILRTQLIDTLRSGNTPPFIVTYPDALMEGIVHEEDFDKYRKIIHIGDEIDRKALRERLWEMGFEETDYVYNPGTFAVRGSLIDIYSYAHEHPVRIDFFGDEVESIRNFDPETQLSHEKLSEVTVLASFSNQSRSHHISLLSLLPGQSLVYVDQLTFLPSSLAQVYDTPPIHREENIHSSLEEMRQFLIEPSVLLDKIKNFTLISRNIEHGEKWKEVEFGQSPEPLFHKKFDHLSEAILRHKEEGIMTAIMSGQKSQIRRLESIFEDQGQGVTFEPIFPTLHRGFVDRRAGIACYTDHTIFERFHKYTLKSDRIRHNDAVLTLKEIHKFEHGDYVVHINHGVGVFAGLFTIDQNGKQQECVRINYKGGDSIYVSIHSLHHISKYKSKDNDEPPQLSKLGTGAWEKLKERTKKKVKDIARDLIKIYAKRMEEKGFAFSPDSFMQKELEASFTYEDTPDQELATAQVKEDMERPVPMDRLICGDVGFGKTEIAVRAAFKAVADSKQVAVLVPTTVLAYQHYRTFKKRLADFPCRVEYLSRAKTTKEQSQLLADLAEGKIDIIIGTHMLTGKRVKYHDLGLLIIDEEQKFGVSVKEKLREYRTHIDTLTMTATPIPRTLQFSLMGARDLSNIQTPPPNRQPVRTEQVTFDTGIISEVINYELARDGQVFFIHNRIHNLNDIAVSIRNAVPGVRIAIGHGQMEPKELETLLIDFVNHEYDVLLTTTIVENGIDVPNANTIIINDAHRFGLSDLHQLRGRVGRGDRKAYCYLITPPLDVLTQDAKRRIRGITTFSDLGSGIHIAMQDLDIRGAGNLLGAEQSGFIADLGYETYRRILEEAVMELRDEEFGEVFEEDEKAKDTKRATSAPERKSYVYETNIETDVEAYLPPTYIPGDDERIGLYRELDSITQLKAIQDFKERLEDRFGKLPLEAEELLKVLHLRLLGKSIGIERISLKRNLLRLQLVSDLNSAYYRSATFATILSNASTWNRTLTFSEENGKRFITVKEVKSITQAYDILTQISEKTLS